MNSPQHGSIVTICAACQKILSPDAGSRKSQSDPEKPVAVSHGLCYDCILHLYPEIASTIKAHLR